MQKKQLTFEDLTAEGLEKYANELYCIKENSVYFYIDPVTKSVSAVVEFSKDERQFSFLKKALINYIYNKTGVQILNILRVENLDCTKNKDERRMIYLRNKQKELFVFENNAVKTVTKYLDNVEKVVAKILGELNIVFDFPMDVHKSLLELGVNSIKAIMLVNRLRQEFALEIILDSKLMNCPVYEWICDIRTGNYNKKKVELVIREDSSYLFPLSPNQERLIKLEESNSIGTTYNNPVAYHICGNINIEQLVNAFQRLIYRHDSLRISFVKKEDVVYQYVRKAKPISIKPIFCRKEDIECVLKESIWPFDLFNDELMRIKLISISQLEHYLFVDIHHAVIDGVSYGMLMKELGIILSGEELALVKHTYKEYCLWSNQVVKDKTNYLSQKMFWEKKYADGAESLILPTDFIYPSNRNNIGGRIRITIKEEISKKLFDFSITNHISLFTVLFTAYNIMLKMYSGQENIIVGIPASNRAYGEFNDVVGYCVNTLPIKTFIDEKESLLNLLKNKYNDILKSLSNQFYQIDHIIQDFNITAAPGHIPLLDTMFVFQDYNLNDIHIPGTKAERVNLNNPYAKFDLALEISYIMGNMVLEFEYATDLFLPESIKKIASTYQEVLIRIANNEIVNICDFFDFSNTYCKGLINRNKKKHFPISNKIYKEFRKQAVKFSEREAIIWNDTKLTYRQLIKHIQTIRELLKRYEFDRNINKVLIFNGPKSISSISWMLAVMSLDGIFLPIDAITPAERVQYIIDDTLARFIVCKRDVEYQNMQQLCILEDNLMLNEIQGFNPALYFEDAAYIIYTSGSTGVPKGVIVGNQGVLNLIAYFRSDIGINEEDCFLQLASISFDASIWEILTCLLSGALLIIPPVDIQTDYIQLEEIIKEKHITTLFMVPELAMQLDPLHVPSLKRMITGGSSSNIELASLWARYTTYMNGYGPTEASICTTTWLLDKNMSIPRHHIVPIGEPIPNTEIYIVDEKGRLCADGSIGEICIGGVGVAIGYLNCHEISEKKFKDNYFTGTGKLYFTGDMGRWIDDKTLEFYGRIDNQIQINGYRVELDEIQHTINQIQGISETVVVYFNDKDYKGLCCYYKVEEEVITAEMIRDIIENRLPYYMVPTHYIRIDQIPKLPSGKIDMKELPKPKIENCVRIKPQNAFELKMLNIWIELLKNNQIGVTDNFFVLGGDSIKAAAISTRIYKELGYRLKGKEFYENPTIKGLCTYIESKLNGARRLQDGCELTVIEKTVKNIWQNVLGIEHIGPDENFFEVGGQSLNVIKLVSEISRVYQVHIPLGEVYYLQTIANMARFIEITPKENINLIPGLHLLKKGTTEKNIFFIHNGVGDIAAYYELSSWIDNTFNVWAIDFELSGILPMDLDIGEQCRKYIVKIKEIQNQGSIYLAGWCIGGTYAYEIARQLENEHNISIELLLLINSRNSKWNALQLVLQQNDILNISDFTVDSEHRVLKILLGDLYKKFNLYNYNNSTLLWGAFIKQAVEMGLDRTVSHCIVSNIHNEMKNAISNIEQISLCELIHKINTIRTIWKSWTNYTVKSKISTRVCFIQANETVQHIDYNIWQNFCNQRIEYHRIDGGHSSIFVQPYLAKLKSVINEILL